MALASVPESDTRLEPRLLGRRSLARVPMDVTLRLHVAGLPGPLPARGRDLGVGGLCTATPTCFSLSDLRRVAVLHANEKLELDVEGRWQAAVQGRDAFLSGLRFLNVEGRARDRLWDIVHDQTKSLSTWLSQQSDLQRIDLADLVELIHAMRVREGGIGEILFRQGARQVGDDSIFLVRSGSVVVETSAPGGHRVGLGDAMRGQLLCSSALLCASAPLETAVVSQPASFLEISRASLGFLQAVHPMLAAELTTILVRRYVERQQAALAKAAGRA